MPGFTDNDNSLATGIPARHISPETGSSGSATMSNKGGTSEGTNEASDSIPAPAAGLETPVSTGKHLKEERSFGSRSHLYTSARGGALDADIESPLQQIADGGDRIKHDDPKSRDHH